MLKEFEAKNGKVWKSILDGEILSSHLILGVFDDISNYEQIEKPKEEIVEDE